jgi:hypothetical protein
MRNEGVDLPPLVGEELPLGQRILGQLRKRNPLDVDAHILVDKLAL